MTIVAVTGDCTTTTCLALAATWPADTDDRDILILEADPSGGSLVGWLDTPSTPSLGTIVANTSADSTRATSTISTIESMVHRSTAGVRFIAAPTRTLAARRAIQEAGATVFSSLATAPSLVALADLGRVRIEDARAVLSCAGTVVVIHRQSRTSAAAEAVRLERLVETVEQIGTTVALAVIGSDPFDPAEIADFVGSSVPGALTDSFALADDDLAAAVLAGRTGVSARRLARLPLMRSARSAARRLCDASQDAMTTGIR